MVNENKINFVFFYIKKNEKKITSTTVIHKQNEEDISYFVSSIKKNHPNSNIIQCTDLDTPKINGTDIIFREKIDQRKIMEARIFLYSKLKLNSISIYLDTDMLLVRKIPYKLFIDEADVFLLKRSFDLNANLPVLFRGQNYNEHLHEKLGEIYPYIGCFLITKNENFWKDCYNTYKNYNDNYKFWFGDQKVIKEIVEKNNYKFAFLNESDFACPPRFTNKNKPPHLIHFKGKNNKNLIKKFYHHIYFSK